MYIWTWIVLLLVLPTWIFVSTADEPEQERDDDDVLSGCKKLEEEKCPKGEGIPLKKKCEKTIYFNCTAECSFSPRSTVVDMSQKYKITTIYVCSTSTIIPTPSIRNSRSIQINPSDNPITNTHDNGKVLTKITITPSFPVSTTAGGDDASGDGSASGDIPWNDFSSSMGIFPSFSTKTITAPSPSDTSEEKNDEDKNNGDGDKRSSGDGSGSGSGDEEPSSDEDQNDDGEQWKKRYSSYRAHNRRKSITRSPRPSSTKQRPSRTVRVRRSTMILNSDLTTSPGNVLGSTLSSIQLPFDVLSGIKSTRTFNSQAEHVSTPSSKNLRSETARLIHDSKMFSSRAKTSRTLTLGITPSTSFTASSYSQSAQPSLISLSISPSIPNSMLHTSIDSKVISKHDNIGSIMSLKILFSSTFIPTSPSSAITGSSSTQSAQSNTTSFGILASATSSMLSTVIPSTITSKPDVSSKILFPSTLIATSVNISSKSSATPPLSPSLSSKSSRIFSSTPVVSSSSREQSIVYSSVLTSSLNVTLQASSSITPTRSTTVVITSSVKTQGRSVYCGESETGEKFEKGILSWQKTRIGTRANTSCPYNKKRIAYRWCRKNMTSMAPYWDNVHDEYCVVLEKNVTIDGLRQMTVTEENEERLAVLVDYLTSHSNATVDLVKGGADLLEKLVLEAINLWKIRKELLNSVSNVMNAPSDVLAEASQKHNSTSKILNFIGQMMNEMSLTGRKFIRENSTNLVAEAWDIANVSHELTFKTDAPEQEENGGSLVSVTLPASLLERYKQKRRITFLNFMNDKLFPQETNPMSFINSKIVSATVKGDEVKNLSDPVVIEFRITNKSLANNCSCVFWDFKANNGLGSWSSNGCTYEVIGDGLSRCTWTHLTHFGVLVNLGPSEEIGDTDKLILEGITFVGCYLSIVGLLLTIITLLSFKQYRNGVSGQILLNLCLALMFTMVIFLGGIKQVDDEVTCVVIAALLHYFVLVAMLWMGIEAFHMFVNIVLDRLPGELGRVFVLKCAVVAWVVPMLIVVITVLVNADDYKNERYCRVKGNSFYIAFLGPGITIMLFNVIAFFLVVKSLLNTRVHTNKQKQGMVHFRRVLGIAVVFGITWLFGVLAVGELRLIFQYLFCITNAFQGFMIFILYCLTDRKVREKLVRFLCVLQDPNANRIIDSTTSTQRPTDIDIDLSMFRERVPSNRSRNWSGTWPRTGHLTDPSPAWITRETAVAPTQVFPPSADYTSNRVIESEDDVPYYFPYPTGSRRVPNIPLPREPAGDKLVESTMSQYLEQSGGEKSLRSVDGSIIFINNGQRVEVPNYTAFDAKELSGSNNNWEQSPTQMHEISLDPSMMNESSFEEPRRYSKGGDGLNFYKRGSRRPRHSSATTSMEMSRRKMPTDRDYRKKGVHFSADELTISPDGSDNLPRWSEVGWFPQMISHTRSLQRGTIQEHDELDGISLPRVERELRRTKSAKPSVAVTADDDVELDYYRRCRKDLGIEDDIASNYLAASESRNSRHMAGSTDESQDRTRKNTEFRQSSDSSASETSSNASFRWSEAGHAPSLKSYSQTTFCDLNSDDNLGPGNETHFTQF